MVDAWPLHWPDGWPRTKVPQKSRFEVSFTEARDGLMEEIKRLGGRLPVLSTNVELRGDGLPYANQRAPKDRGVAVYFQYKQQQRVFACDRWDSVKDNMRALQKTIEAIRGIERWGASDMLDRAFSGFVALPAPSHGSNRHWRAVLDIEDMDPIYEVNIHDAYRRLARSVHPDRGGSDEAMAELNVARDQGLKEVRGK
jgi:hypothetical protein